jgi:DNA-binding LacI/PurR family transcriptional regulator
MICPSQNYSWAAVSGAHPRYSTPEGISLRNPRITSLEVARLAGVSRATVSLVLNNSDRVSLSPGTRKRVFEAAEQLGYKPNSAARMLVSGVSETIGLVVTNPSVLLHDAYIPQILYGIEKANSEMGFHVLLEGLRTDDQDVTYDNLVKSRRIDGLIVLNPRANDLALASLIDRGFPVVLIGSLGHPEEYSVTSPGDSAMAEAARHIVELGHRRIGAITFAPLSFTGARDRLKLLRDMLWRCGATLEDDCVEVGDFSADSGYEAAIRLLKRRPDLTAIFAGNDTIAIGLLNAAQELGRKIPSDLSVIGYDDLHFAHRLNPPLTTVFSDGVSQGVAAAKMLFARLGHGEIGPSRITLEASFVQRASTQRAPSPD